MLSIIVILKRDIIWFFLASYCFNNIPKEANNPASITLSYYSLSLFNTLSLIAKIALINNIKARKAKQIAFMLALL